MNIHSLCIALRSFLLWGALVLFGGCAASLQNTTQGDLMHVARQAVEAGCAPLAAAPPIPTQTTNVRDESAFDVVVYTAHPDDESMYAGGTLNRLTAAGRKAAVVVLSHGEGGNLVERDDTGQRVPRTDRPRSLVSSIRDREMARAAQLAGVALTHLYPAEANVDFAFNTSCPQTLRHWDRELPGGVAEILRRLVADIRARRPRVIITMDVRDDPGGSKHGHHTAMGALVDLAVRLAADPSVGDGPPHAIEELLTFGPRGQPYDVAIVVDPRTRLAMLRAHASQFLPHNLAGLGSRPEEHFVLQWRAHNASPPAKKTTLQTMLALAPGAASPAPETVIEVLPVALRAGQVHLLAPESGASWRIPHVAAQHPNETVAKAVRDLGLGFQLVHSTSWRHRNEQLIFTYLAVLEPTTHAPKSFVWRPFTPGAVGRGDATLPPDQIDVPAVLNHALEHLAWLLREDKAVSDVLHSAWRPVLKRYAPKPFLSEPGKNK